jgi:hypothetical protein
LIVAMVMPMRLSVAIINAMRSMHVLLGNAIDYAGLFPPAALDMRTAVAQYAGYLAGEWSWALGRFVVPVSRLPEFESAAGGFGTPQVRSWRLAVLPGQKLAGDLEAIAEFNHRHGQENGSYVIDTIEAKADSVRSVEDTMHRVAHLLQAYIEIPVNQDPTELIDAIGENGGRAKVRTGGTTPDAFPSSWQVIRFMGACVRAKVPFKATAGLHHPVRAEYHLTYAPDSPRGTMFGFLNLFLAAAFLRAGMEEDRALEVLEESSAEAFQVESAGIAWNGERLGLADLERARQEVIVSFGSCSFVEPINDLQALHLLAPRVHQA